MLQYIKPYLLVVLLILSPATMFASEKVTVILVGDTAVGKTSILHRYVHGEFPDSVFPTVSVDLKAIPDAEMNGYFLDVSGYKRFRHIISCYLPMAYGYALIYDVTDQKSFDDIVWWYKRIKLIGKKDAPLILVANKTDQKIRDISTQQGQKLATYLDIPYMEVSAYSGSNIRESLSELLQKAASFSIEKNLKNQHLESKP